MTAPVRPSAGIRGMIDATLDRRGFSAPALGVARGPRAFLSSEHEIHAKWLNHWKWLDTTMKGGQYVKQLLRRFDWEVPGGDSIVQRQRTATYPNWPFLFASTLAGFLTRSAPVPSYGGLGNLTPADTDETRETRADLFHYNVDGQGGMGSEWNAWWAERIVAAATFGMVWIHEEAPGAMPGTRTGTQDQEARGVRPYLIEWRPMSVWDWHYGPSRQLEYIIIRYKERVVQQIGATFNSGLQTRFYLHTRRGFLGFGPDYAGGGYWLYDERGEVVLRDGVPVQGTYDSLGGEIPIHPLFAQRDSGTEDMPAISRSMVEELAAMAEGYMNLASARDFEVFDAAKGMEWFLGVDQRAFDLAMNKIADGARFIPVPGTAQHPSPTIVSSSAATVPSEVFTSALTMKNTDAAAASGITQNAGPDASGVAREADFAAAKAPILALFAAELQSCQNTSIRNIQKRWGITPAAIGGGVVWPRKFELVKLSEALSDVFDAAVLIGAKSETLMAKGIVRMGQENGAIPSEDAATIEKEIRTNFTTDQQATAAKNSLQSAPRPQPGPLQVNVNRTTTPPTLPTNG
jgi:hypothetical protein